MSLVAARCARPHQLALPFDAPLWDHVGLETALIRDEQRLKLVDSGCAWYVATRGNDIVGCARVTVHPEHPLLAYLERRDYGYVYGLFVRDDERGRGAGKALLGACEAWLKKRGVKWLFLHSTPEAMDFYEGRGYEPCLEYGKRL